MGSRTIKAAPHERVGTSEAPGLDPDLLALGIETTQGFPAAVRVAGPYMLLGVPEWVDFRGMINRHTRFGCPISGYTPASDPLGSVVRCGRQGAWKEVWSWPPFCGSLR